MCAVFYWPVFRSLWKDTCKGLHAGHSYRRLAVHYNTKYFLGFCKNKKTKDCVCQCGALLAFSHLVYQVCLLCILHITSGADPGFCEGGFERGFVDSLKGTFEQK